MKFRESEINRLSDACCKEFNVNIDDFFIKSRRRNLVDARRTFFHIIKHFYDINELEMSISLPFNYHRTTIMFQVDCADDLIKFDSKYLEKYKNVYKSFTGSNFEVKEPNKRNYKKKFKQD